MNASILLSFMLSALPQEAKINWSEHVSTLVPVYNCTKSNSTGFSPFHLMYRRHLMLPIDVESGVRIPDMIASTTHKYL